VQDASRSGRRAVPVEPLSDRYQRCFKGLQPGPPDYIRAYNTFAGEHENVLAKSCFTAGTTWPGIYAYEDRRAVDYLLTRPDVDPARIGCGGLSGGGLRTLLLAGTAARIPPPCAAGFLTPGQDLLHCPACAPPP